MRVAFGVGTGRNQPIAAIRGHARRAEKLGFDHITFLDSQNLSRDVYVMMTLAAIETNRIKIGHGVTNPFTRHWSVTANATATIYELSGGRAFIGIGPGMSATGTLGKQPAKLAEVRKAIEAMRTMTGGGSVPGDEGGEVRSEWSRDPIPVYLGSDGPKSMMMAGEIADGCMSTSVDPAIWQWRLGVLRRGAESAGRDLASLDLWARTMCYVGDPAATRQETQSYAATNATSFYMAALARDTPEGRELRAVADPELLEDIKTIHDNYDYYAHERIDAAHGNLVTDRVMNAFILSGSRDQIVDRIGELATLGIRTVSITDYSIRDKLGNMERFASDIMPNFYS